MRSKSTGQVGTQITSILRRPLERLPKRTDSVLFRAPQRHGGNGGLLELTTQRQVACSHSHLHSQLTFSHIPPESPTTLLPQTHREAFRPLLRCLQLPSVEANTLAGQRTGAVRQGDAALQGTGWTRATGANQEERKREKLLELAHSL